MTIAYGHTRRLDTASRASPVGQSCRYHVGKMSVFLSVQGKQISSSSSPCCVKKLCSPSLCLDSHVLQDLLELATSVHLLASHLPRAFSVACRVQRKPRTSAQVPQSIFKVRTCFICFVILRPQFSCDWGSVPTCEFSSRLKRSYA